ncbi:hypothetical protein [Phaeobacter sp. S60]|uniref:hypothetical protein n=1 Tax=Phaeobacter sp. S60 TaxID=1569353 RepID=UPI00058E2C5F|nr:hypothetical protein [Phaeobacter sp. S60]KII14714.1 hypothetical protein OO25_09940 [Phaeobacter sp. S60]
MTDLIKAADALAEAVNEQLSYMDLCGDKGDLERNMRNALTAYRQARESADGVKVKPLDMPERRNGYWGNKDGYQVAHTRDDLFRVRFHGKVICRDIRGFDRAVEWANKHNEARIKAALDPQ